MWCKVIKWLCQSKLTNAAMTGARQENDMENQTQTVTIEEVKSLAEQLGALGKNANQTQLAEAIAVRH
jgi:hypothetical protein